MEGNDMITRELTPQDFGMLADWLAAKAKIGCAAKNQAEAAEMITSWTGGKYHGVLVGSFDDPKRLHSVRGVAVHGDRGYILVLAIKDADEAKYVRSFEGFMAWCRTVGIKTVCADTAAWKDERSANWSRGESAVQLSKVLKRIALNPRLETRTISGVDHTFFTYDVSA
jgi:hypothetical protein